MPGVTNNDIMSKLGELAEGMRGVRRELDAASESRKGLYEKMEEQNANIRNMQFAGEQQVQINAQTRDEIKALHSEQQVISDNIKPLLDLKLELPSMVEAWRDMRKTSQRLVWLLGLGGLTVGTTLIFFGNAVLMGLQHWLGIQPKG